MKNTSLIDILSNENLEKFLSSLKWEYFEAGSWYGERADNSEIKAKSLLFFWILTSMQYFNLGSYQYKIHRQSLERSGPLIKRKPKSQFQVIKRLVNL